MELNEYQDRAMKTCTKSSNNFSYMIHNLIAEVGELTVKAIESVDTKTGSSYQLLKIFALSSTRHNVLAKAIRKGFIEYEGKKEKIDEKEYKFDLKNITSEQKEGLKKEAGDILWQLAGMCSVMGWNLEDIAQMNIDKLASRQERGVIVGDGDNR